MFIHFGSDVYFFRLQLKLLSGSIKLASLERLNDGSSDNESPARAKTL